MKNKNVFDEAVKGGDSISKPVKFDEAVKITDKNFEKLSKMRLNFTSKK